MALKGDLRSFSIVQLLNLIHLARKSGRLSIAAEGEVAELYFQDGKLVYASLRSRPQSLLDVLYQARRLPAKQYKAFKARTQKLNDKALGLLLVNAGYFTPQEILAILRDHYTNIVRKLFTWIEGRFVFESGVPMPKDRIPVRLGLGNLIIEGSRQLREWERLREEIPDLNMALKFVDQPQTDVKSLNLSVEEWRVIAYVNPKNSLRKIARTLKLNDLEIRRIAYALIQAGIVELVRPEDYRPKRVLQHAFVNRSKEESISLVQRIINRISR
ncbi:MAG: DUF4388 domain-containing protein [Chloroflexi bacterium]|nr:DUF4388 domain-containing protein [Chloroflexota bacterium]